MGPLEALIGADRTELSGQAEIQDPLWTVAADAI